MRWWLSPVTGPGLSSPPSWRPLSLAWPLSRYCHKSQRIRKRNLSQNTENIQVSDSLSEVTLVDCLVTASSAMAHVSQGWLWLGLLLILVLVTSLTLTLGHITLLVSVLPR